MKNVNICAANGCWEKSLIFFPLGSYSSKVYERTRKLKLRWKLMKFALINIAGFYDDDNENCDR